jgi:hypothetical protein
VREKAHLGTILQAVSTWETPFCPWEPEPARSEVLHAQNPPTPAVLTDPPGAAKNASRRRLAPCPTRTASAREPGPHRRLLGSAAESGQPQDSPLGLSTGRPGGSCDADHEMDRDAILCPACGRAATCAATCGAVGGAREGSKLRLVRLKLGRHSQENPARCASGQGACAVQVSGSALTPSRKPGPEGSGSGKQGTSSARRVPPSRV